MLRRNIIGHEEDSGRTDAEKSVLGNSLEALRNEGEEILETGLTSMNEKVAIYEA